MVIYVGLKIPKTLMDKIDLIISNGNLGYASRAEFVKDAVRILLSSLNNNNTQKNLGCEERTSQNQSQ